LHDAQTQLANLELIYLHAFCKCVESSKMKNCNLETVLGSQKDMFGRIGLGYKVGKKNNVKKLSSFFYLC